MTTGPQPDLQALYTRYPRLDPAVWHRLMGLEVGGHLRSDDPPVEHVANVGSDRSHISHSEASSGRSGRRGNPDFALPSSCERDGHVEFPEQQLAGATRAQLDKAAEMHRLGLCSKAKRQASCAVYARMRACENGHQYYQRYCCKNRYCPNEACGRKGFLDLFEKYLRLDSVAREMVPDWETRPRRRPRSGDFVIAKIDITIINTGRMPTRGEVREFNRDVRRLFRAAEKEFGLIYPKRIRADGHLASARPPRPGDYGVLWTDEFGGKSKRPDRRGNTNLHAHAVYCGPYLPQQWLSETWAKIRGDGSKIVSIKLAHTFRAGLYHALKYAGKFLSNDPSRLAELELAFDRVRRVHMLGGFYNAVPKGTETASASPHCPTCGGMMLDATGPLRPVGHFEMQGLHDFDEMRRGVGRERVLKGAAP